MNNKKNLKNRRGALAPKPRTIFRGWETSPQIGLSAPDIRSSSDSLIVRNREIINTLSATFTTGSAPTGGSNQFVAFGGSNSFPSTSWLFGLADSYDKYKFRKLRISFQPILPVTTGGAIGLWFDADAESATAPASYTALSGNMNVQSGSIFDCLSVDVKSSQMNRLPYYLTLTNSTAGGNNSYSPGTVKAAWSSIISANASLTGSQALGYIWADYEIEFLNPTNPAT